MLYSIIFVLHLMICIFLVIVVLMQASKGGGLASTFGGGAGLGTSVFGGRAPEPEVQHGQFAQRFPVPVRAPQELYLLGDRDERQNLASGSDHAELIADLSQLLAARCAAGRPRSRRAGSIRPMQSPAYSR